MKYILTQLFSFVIVTSIVFGNASLSWSQENIKTTEDTPLPNSLRSQANPETSQRRLRLLKGAAVGISVAAVAFVLFSFFKDVKETSKIPERKKDDDSKAELIRKLDAISQNSELSPVQKHQELMALYSKELRKKQSSDEFEKIKNIFSPKFEELKPLAKAQIDAESDEKLKQLKKKSAATELTRLNEQSALDQKKAALIKKIAEDKAALIKEAAQERDARYLELEKSDPGMAKQMEHLLAPTATASPAEVLRRKKRDALTQQAQEKEAQEINAHAEKLLAEYKLHSNSRGAIAISKALLSHQLNEDQKCRFATKFVAFIMKKAAENPDTSHPEAAKLKLAALIYNPSLKITLGGSFDGVYVDDNQFNGQKIPEAYVNIIEFFYTDFAGQLFVHSQLLAFDSNGYLRGNDEDRQKWKAKTMHLMENVESIGLIRPK